MRSSRVPDLQSWSEPDASAWSRVRAERVALTRTPLGLQPNPYLMTAWSTRPYGRLAALDVACVHDGDRVAFHLEWKDASEDLASGEAFPDAAAVALPVRGAPQLATMGAPDAPVHALHWVAGEDGVRSVLASGIGSSRPGPDVGGAARALWKDGGWRVVVSRSLAAPAEAASLAPGEASRIGFAVWDGANGERAGIKAFSIDWRPLELEP